MKSLKSASNSKWKFPKDFPESGYQPNQVFECVHRDMAILLYDSKEIRMGSEYAKVAIFTNCLSPRAEVHDPMLSAWVDEQTIFVDSNEKYLFFRREMAVDQNYDFPFVVISLDDFSFAFYRMKHGLDYSIEESQVAFILRRHGSLRSLPDRDNTPLDPTQLAWFSKAEISRMAEVYFETSA